MTTPSTLYLVPSSTPKQAQNPQKPNKQTEPDPPKNGDPTPPATFYEAPRISGGSLWHTLATTLLVTAGIFFILPFTRYIDQLREDLLAFEDNTIELAPPPPLPPIEEQREEEKEEESEPELVEEEPEPISLSELQASLAVGTGTGFRTKSLEEMLFQVQDIGDMIFEIKDLDQKPRLISAERPEYPHVLKTQGIEGEVVLLVMINREGRVSILGVKSSTNREFEKSSIRAARSARYTAPMRNGEKVSVKFYLPFNFTITD